MKTGISAKEWATCLKVLNHLKDHPFDSPDDELFKTLITKIHKTARKTIRKTSAHNRKTEDLDNLLKSRIAQQALNNTTCFGETGTEPSQQYVNVHAPVGCYICGTAYQQVHFFYNRLCPACAEYNYARRTTEIDLKGRNVILTGGRVKIGYAAALKLLRNGANLLLTTRFPALALEQLQNESDYSHWKDRVVVYGLDLKNLKAVEDFIIYVRDHYNSLDILVNNAAQTIKYPAEYYLPLINREVLKLKEFSGDSHLLPNTIPLSDTVGLIEAGNDLLPDFKLNRFGQPVDERMKNSWNSKLDEVGAYELLEVNLINHISPYLLIKVLKPLLLASAFKEKFIINVTSSEGQFSYSNKTVYHPHTNMTKAALNMLTRTSAHDLVNDHIYMNSVDVGWVSTGVDEQLRARQFERGYIPPLDPVDGASRILHPIEEILNGNRLYGRLLKNYRVVEW